MQIGPLDLPDEVLTALEEKRLVIFAGAGVSIPPPASLPNFPGLVEGIVGRALCPGEVEQMDRVLGRAKEQGVPVHRLAAERLAQPESRFNSLHENLVALFGSATALRIVTTNFDQHFEGAIAAARPELRGAEVYRSPALPVGSSFVGLAHLHGVLGPGRAPEELVLTDADFGRAYLTEGWAGRFVLELFREFTVLFVGYSYGDTVMSYLTRGLAPTFGRQRFALTKIGDLEKWQLLGIHPIGYDPAKDHRSLAEGLSQWVSYNRRGFLDWGQRLPALAGREPRALAPDEQGELEFCLKSPKRAKLFYQHANDPGWLEWAEECGRLNPLFSFDANQESIRHLAQWFTEDPLGDRGTVALRIALRTIRPVGGALAALASQQVNRALAGRKVLEPAHAQRVAAWATLLIERTAPNTPSADLSFWLMYLSPQDHPQLVVQILAHLLRCQPMFHEGTICGRRSELDLALETRQWADLSYDWRGLRQHIDVLAWPLVPVITEVFESRWRWQVTLAASTARSDPWSWVRPWVERPPGDNRSHDNRMAGPLLDVGKDVLDELLASASERSTAVIELWLAASAPQLVQLGLYGLAKSSQWKPAKKLDLLVAKHLPAKMPFKVETFRVLRESYTQLTPGQRKRFLKRVERPYRKAIDERRSEPDRHRTAVDEWFNVLVWLERAAPGDPLLERAIAAVRQSYPEIQPRDHPELDILYGQVKRVQPKSVLPSEDIARLSFPQWSAWLATSGERQRRDGPSTDYVGGFLEETARAASEHLEWGLAFARCLLEDGEFEHQVWPMLLNAWGHRTLRPGEWRKVIGVLDHPQLLAAQTSAVTDVVCGRTTQKDPKATPTMLRSALRLAEKLLPLAEAIPFAILSEDEAWLIQAINHPGGGLAEFLIRATGELLGPGPQQGNGVPRPCQRMLDAMADGTGNASAMGRVVLATRTHYFLQIDPDWTRESLLPLFDWSRDPIRAVQAWHGFLAGGRPGAALLEALTPAAVQLASHLDELAGEREHYGRFIARSSFSLPDDPLGKAWFQAFLARANGDDRTRFAWELDDLIETLRPEQKAEIWRDWLRRYLEQRSQLPPPPEGEELAALFGWSFKLPGQLAELVECLEALTGRGTAVGRLAWKLKEDELEGTDPNLRARLLLALVKRCEKVEYWELSALQAVIKRLAKERADEKLISELEEKYLENGGSWQGLLES